MNIELLFADNGLCIGDRDKHNAVTLSYGEMFQLVHEFLEICRLGRIVTENGELIFQRLKEGDGSPFPVIAVDKKGISRQIKFNEIIGIIPKGGI